MMALNRRSLLTLAMSSLGASLAGPGVLGGRAFAQSRRVAMVSLRDGVVQLTGAGGNVVAFSDGEVVALVDSGAPEHTSELVELLRHNLEGEIELLFNSHWHLEHTGGNEAFAMAGARIIAHQNTKLWMSTTHFVDWQDRTYHPRPHMALPTDTFYSHEPQPRRITLGTEAIEYGHLREAHTDGDIYVFFPRRNVLVAGGAVSASAYPVPDYSTGGWIGGLMDATRKLLEIADRETLIVPSVGPAQRLDHLRAQYEMLATVRERIENLMRQGRSAEEMLAAGVTDEFDEQWGDNRERFVSNVYDGLWWQGRLGGSL